MSALYRRSMHFFAWKSGAPAPGGPWTLPTLPTPLLRHCLSLSVCPNNALNSTISVVVSRYAVFSQPHRPCAVTAVDVNTFKRKCEELSPRGRRDKIPPRRWQFDSRRIYVRPRTGPQSTHLWGRR